MLECEVIRCLESVVMVVCVVKIRCKRLFLIVGCLVDLGGKVIVV